jgi:prepilin-type N-terminal cleavage/methylation domain-containing protein
MKKLISRSPKRDQRGFTLIELLVVIAIIAILAALILAALNAAQKGARDSRRQSNINQFKTALANYYSDNDQVYPPGTGSSTAMTTTNAPCNALAANGNYIASGCTLVTDPKNSSYWYNAAASNATTFTICVQEERDKKKAFAAGPTETKTLTASGSGDFQAGDCTGVN